MISIIENFKLPISINVHDIQEKSQHILNFLDRTADEVTIVIDDNEGIQKINAQYAGHDYSTDVLSFASNEIDPETGNNYLGDIIISFERVSSQAKEKAHSVEIELYTLIAHGVLHLLGHDHAQPEETRIMFTLQDELVRDLIGG